MSSEEREEVGTSLVFRAAGGWALAESLTASASELRHPPMLCCDRRLPNLLLSTTTTLRYLQQLFFFYSQKWSPFIDESLTSLMSRVYLRTFVYAIFLFFV